MKTVYIITIAVGCSVVAVFGILFGFNDSFTNVKTEFTGIQCPEKHYLAGYDVSGQPICKIIPAEYTVSNATMRWVLKGEQTDYIFNTTSQTFVSTGFPVNNKFIKKYDDSQIWAFLTIDHRNTETGRTNFIALGIDGTVGNTIWAYDFAKGGAIQAFTGLLIGEKLEAGEHTIDLDVAVNGGTGKFMTDLALLNIYEVPIERP